MRPWSALLALLPYHSLSVLTLALSISTTLAQPVQSMRSVSSSLHSTQAALPQWSHLLTVTSGSRHIWQRMAYSPTPVRVIVSAKLPLVLSSSILSILNRIISMHSGHLGKGFSQAEARTSSRVAGAPHSVSLPLLLPHLRICTIRLIPPLPLLFC